MLISTRHKIISGDSRQMKEVEDNSVHLIITSPPYWQLKDYGSENQIGFNDSYESYINNLNIVWKESHRVLENGCRLCINIGDQFARSVYYGRYKVIPIRTEVIKFCESIGFDYMGAIIWQKKTTTNTTGGASIMGSYPVPRNGIISIDYEFILLFKKLGKPIKPDIKMKSLSELSKEEWKEYFSGHWNFGGVRQSEHIAMFPEELPKRLIKMFSFVGDTVLDPFLGSGTTTLSAIKLDRNSVGYEINPEFTPLIKRKINIEQPSLLDFECEFICQGKVDIDYEKELGKFPYVFNDFHKFDKIIDPKKLQFGSKIDNNNNNREEYFNIEEIVSPEIMKLDNGLIIRLIGIKKDEHVTNKAVDFLKKKTLKQKVFLKFDNVKYDGNNHLLCYLYLKNKTFLNAHLIKEGLALVDKDVDFRYKSKFIKLSEGAE